MEKGVKGRETKGYKEGYYWILLLWKGTKSCPSIS